MTQSQAANDLDDQMEQLARIREVAQPCESIHTPKNQRWGIALGRPQGRWR